MNNLHKYVIMAVLLGATCFSIYNIAHPISAMTIYPKSNLSTILQDDEHVNYVLPQAKGYVDKHSLEINFFNITYVNNTQQPVINNAQQQIQDITNKGINDILTLQPYTPIAPLQQQQVIGSSNNDNYPELYQTLLSTNSEHHSSSSSKSIKTNHDDTQKEVEKMVKEGKLVDGQTISVPKHPPQKYEDENSEGLPFDSSNLEYEGIIKDATDNYVIINGAPYYVDTKINNANLVDYNDETHNPILNVGDLQENGYDGVDTLYEQQQKHLKDLGLDKPRPLEETNKEREQVLNPELSTTIENAIQAPIVQDDNNNDDETQDHIIDDNDQAPNNIDTSSLSGGKDDLTNSDDDNPVQQENSDLPTNDDNNNDESNNDINDSNNNSSDDNSNNDDNSDESNNAEGNDE